MTTCNKMFNGKSMFGVTSSGSESTELGSIVIDDAHRCVDIIKEAFSINIERKKGDRESKLYTRLLALFMTL